MSAIGNRSSRKGVLSSVLIPTATTPFTLATEWRCPLCRTHGAVYHNGRDSLVIVLALAMVEHDGARALGRRMVEYKFLDHYGQIVSAKRRHHGMESMLFGQAYPIKETDIPWSKRRPAPVPYAEREDRQVTRL